MYTIFCTQVKWPEEDCGQPPNGTVDIDQWWGSLERNILEAVVFKAAMPESVLATKIAPWIPSACRSFTAYNTEHVKGRPSSSADSRPIACPKKLAEMIRTGRYNPLHVSDMPLAEVKQIAAEVEMPSSIPPTKVLCVQLLIPSAVTIYILLIQPQLVKHLESLYSHLIQGKSECHHFEAVPRCSGGKVFTNCQHQVYMLFVKYRFHCIALSLIQGCDSIKVHLEERKHSRLCRSATINQTLACSVCRRYGM